MRLKHNSKKLNKNIVDQDSKLNNQNRQTQNYLLTLALLAEEQQQKQDKIQSMQNKNNYKNYQKYRTFTQICQSPTVSQKQYQKAINNYQKYIHKIKEKQGFVHQNNIKSQIQTNPNAQFKRIKLFKNQDRFSESIQIIRNHGKRLQNKSFIKQFKCSPSASKTFSQIKKLRNLQKDSQNIHCQLLSIQQYFNRQKNKTDFSIKSGQQNQTNQYGYYLKPKLSKQAKKWYSSQKKYAKTQQSQQKNKPQIINFITNQQRKKQVEKHFLRSKSLPIQQFKCNQFQNFVSNEKLDSLNQKINQKQTQKCKNNRPFKYKKHYEKKNLSQQQSNIEQQDFILKQKENKIFQYPWNWIKFQFSPNIHAKLWK